MKTLESCGCCTEELGPEQCVDGCHVRASKMICYCLHGVTFHLDNSHIPAFSHIMFTIHPTDGNWLIHCKNS